MYKSAKFHMTLLALFIFLTAGCFRNPSGDADSEFRSLMDSQYSASGSELTYAVCGWPVSGRMKLKNLKLDMFPGSTSESGRGYAEISTEGDGFNCGGKIFFVYNYSYTGGHGYSGGTSLRMAILERESSVDEKISNPGIASAIETGRELEGELSETDIRLPDNAPADYYYLELKDKNPGVKITTSGKIKSSITGCIYQNNIPVSTLTPFGTKLKPGRAVILVTAGGKRGKYSIKIDELSEAEKSNLK